VTTKRSAALEGNLHLLRQGIELLERLSDGDYRDAPEGGSSIGAQYRHVLDHYRSLLDGQTDGVVDYDRRRRDPEQERDRAAAIRATEETLDRLRLLSRTHLLLPLAVAQAATDSEADESPQGSTLGRELLFLVSHTVHHYAIIKLLLGERGVTCEPSFGVAPSTLVYRRAAS
jgi:uncharacterized damage-inducible protein DinB